jgi:hypothetical protein
MNASNIATDGIAHRRAMAKAMSAASLSGVTRDFRGRLTASPYP